MAVARPELTVRELEWLVQIIKAAPKPPYEARGAPREIERNLVKARDIQARENRAKRRMQDALPTAPPLPQ